jgi:hypothetical protein
MGIAAAKKAEAIDLKLRVNDVAISGKTVTTIIEDLGGSKIDRVPGEGLEVITANLQFIQLKELFKKLKIVGEIEEKPIPPAISEEFVALRIEIVKK